MDFIGPLITAFQRQPICLYVLSDAHVYTIFKSTQLYHCFFNVSYNLDGKEKVFMKNTVICIFYHFLCRPCNCDAADSKPRADGGIFNTTDRLPILEMQFTESGIDGAESAVTLGKLFCTEEDFGTYVLYY